jgi:hypothetical protein
MSLNFEHMACEEDLAKSVLFLFTIYIISPVTPLDPQIEKFLEAHSEDFRRWAAEPYHPSDGN